MISSKYAPRFNRCGERQALEGAGGRFFDLFYRWSKVNCDLDRGIKLGPKRYLHSSLKQSRKDVEQPTRPRQLPPIIAHIESGQVRRPQILRNALRSSNWPKYMSSSASSTVPAQAGHTVEASAPLDSTAPYPPTKQTDDTNNTTVFVGKLSPCVTEHELRSCFQGFGEIASVKVLDRGRGFIEFIQRNDAEKAITELQGHLLDMSFIYPEWKKLGCTHDFTNYVPKIQEKIEKVRNIMRLVPQPVVVVTSSTPEGEYHGMTVSSFTTVCLTPEPIVSFNIKGPSRTLDTIKKSRQFLIHTPRSTIRGALIADFFSGTYTDGELSKPILLGQSPLQISRFSRDGLELPLLADDDISGVMRCSLIEEVKGGPGGLIHVGDHVLLLAKVQEIVRHSKNEAKAKRGLCYTGGKYWSLGPTLTTTEASSHTKKTHPSTALTSPSTTGHSS